MREIRTLLTLLEDEDPASYHDLIRHSRSETPRPLSRPTLGALMKIGLTDATGVLRACVPDILRHMQVAEGGQA